MEYTDKSKKVDIFVEKYVSKNGAPFERVENPSFIEAKRARRWVPEIVNGTAKQEGLQNIAVQNDIGKLRAEMKMRNPGDSIHCHVLVWGVYTTESRTDHPLKFFEHFDDQIHWRDRWRIAPVAMDHESP